MPHSAADDKESILLNQMPEKVEVSVTDEFTAKWELIYSLRASVTKALELKRADKFIGASLEAKVTLHIADKAVFDKIVSFADILPAVFIVSAVDVQNNADGEFKAEGIEGDVSFSVEKASGGKCERCWCYSEEVGTVSEHPTLCKRCASQI